MIIITIINYIYNNNNNNNNINDNTNIEQEDVKWDIIGLSEDRMTGEEFIELMNGHIFCYREQKTR